MSGLAVRIHRGANEIGGSCVELESGDKRLVLDAGLPLTTEPPVRELLPDVPGLWAEGDGSLLALLLSHTHLDHCGLADLAAVPTFLGETAAEMHDAASFFRPWAPRLRTDGVLHHSEQLVLGPFSITPWRVDHSAADAYAFEVAAGGRRLVYSGDLRGHGSEPQTLRELAVGAVSPDVVLLEGTRIGRDGESSATSTELMVEDAAIGLLQKAGALVLALSSGEDIARLETFHRAARRVGRTFVVDLYAATLWSACRGQLPSDVRVLVSNSQRNRIIESEAFDRLDAIRGRRVFAEWLAERPQRYLVACRASAVCELERSGALLDGEALWSMWEGYLRDDHRLVRLLRRNGVLVTQVHASGHATPADLRQLVSELRPNRVVPIHTAHPEGYLELFDDVELHDDGEWWEV